MKPWFVTIQMKAIEQYFHVVLFIRLCKVVLTFQSVGQLNLSVSPSKRKLLSSSLIFGPRFNLVIPT